LEYGATLLLEKLFAYLSQLPEEEDSTTVTSGKPQDPLATPQTTNTTSIGHPQGISLPAAAVAWLAGQLYPFPWEEEEEDEKKMPSNDNNSNDNSNAAVTLDDASASCSLVTPYPQFNHLQSNSHGRDMEATNDQVNMGMWLGGTALRDRLSLLRFLLPRVKMICITRQAWPPELPSGTKQKQPTSRSESRQEVPITPPRRQRPPAELNCSTISSVNSALTTEQDIGMSPRLAFLQYMHQLQHAPAVDMRIFPRLAILMLDGVPPSWVVNLHTLQPSLQVLRLDRAAVYHLPNLLFSKTQLSRMKQQQQEKRKYDEKAVEAIDDSSLAVPKSFYPSLTHVKLDHCTLGDQSGISWCLSKLQSVKNLSLQHNDIHQERTLRGLRTMINLTQLDLRHNLLSSLPRANLYLGGQIHTLKLSYNRITTTRGLDRCYALQELWLDGNCIQDLHQVSGLARLPQLQTLRLFNNPVTTIGDAHYDPGWKVQLWTWFQEERRATVPMELPVLVDLAGMVRGGGLVLQRYFPTEREWRQIQDGSFTNVTQTKFSIKTDFNSQIATPSRFTPVLDMQLQSNDEEHTDSFLSDSEFLSLLTPSAKSMATSLQSPSLQSVGTTKKARTRRAMISDGRSATRTTKPLRKHQNTRRIDATMTTRPIEKTSSDVPGSVSTPNIRFSLEDVIASLQKECPLDPKEDFETETEVVEANGVQTTDGDENAPIDALFPQMQSQNTDPVGLEDEVTNPFCDVNELHEVPEAEESEISASNQNDDESAKQQASLDEGIEKEKEIEHQNDTEEQALQVESLVKDSAAPIAPAGGGSIPVEDRIFPNPKPKVGIIKLHKQVPTNTLSLLECDWDELIKRVSEGQIPDGIAKSPVINLEHSASAITLEMRNGASKVFSDDAVDLLQSDSAMPNDQAVVNQSMASFSASGPLDTTFDSLPNTLPDHVWKDDNSALSSLGASLENIPPMGVSKFQIAEENSFYDGPDSCREMKVMENLKLYFEVFVFSKALPTMPQTVLLELEEDHDDWQSVILYYPRIQLWPDDRQRLERLVLSAAAEGTDLAENRERFLHLWEEEVIPCGKPTLRRLPPNRRVRLGFHGDKLFEGPDLDAYSERRNVLLCLSSKAFYVILREDAVTLHHKEQSKQRRFPLPIDRDVLFRDAPWPHSIARHSLLDLQAICIGFEFQRLTLRFQNASFSKSDPFVYVILCSNKKATVAILQQLQKAWKDLREATGGAVGSAESSQTLAIENDSNHVFDALTEAVSPEPLGTILHYQILQQCWKHGDRGTVRRACVLTETNIFLLDEDYSADGHNLSEVTVKVEKMADVKYRKVDEASLKQVTEVQAAGNDPRAITIIIVGLTTLSRTHRWRLVCRDREGAERLVDDVRKAVANFVELNSASVM
jgi:Leucine-rich repeat (LRR) protein